MSSRSCLVFIAAIGCGYTSSYVPPDSSRLRPVWIGRSIVAVGPTAMPSCAGEPGTPLLIVVPEPHVAVQIVSLVPEGDDTDALSESAAAAAATLLAAAGLASAALGLAFAPAGTTQSNAVTIDAINEFNDELRRPTRCESPSS